MNVLFDSIRPDDHMQGDRTVTCSLVEYGDYECSSCAQIQPALKELQRKFGSRLSFVFRNFPLSDIHPWAEKAAEVAEFAGKHNKFWEMHDLLFANQDRFSDDLFLELVDKVGLPYPQLLIALERNTFQARVLAEFQAGLRSGVNGTPTFFIDEDRYDGSIDYDSLAEAITRALSENIRYD
jgi:protein-disulfide isomerase